MTEKRASMLVCIDHFLPDTSFGGPVASVSCIARALRSDFEMEIATRDKEFASGRAFAAEEMDETRSRLGIPIHFLRADALLLWRLGAVLRRSARTSSLVYLNSVFSRRFSLFPLILLRALKFRGRVVIATRGELAPSSLAVKSVRKSVFLKLANATRFYAHCTFHAATEDERQDILRALPGTALHGNVRVAIDIPEVPPMPPVDDAIAARDPLRIALVSRVVPGKNHGFLIDLVRQVSGRVHVTFAGAVQDKRYWEDCEAKLADLPSRITWEQVGHVNPVERTKLLEKSHLFVLPTLGESYGHAIAEALAAGCPVLISDRTPWKGLNAAGVGAELPLETSSPWVAAIDALGAMSDDAYLAMRHRAQAFLVASLADSHAIEAHRTMFRAALKDFGSIT